MIFLDLLLEATRGGLVYGGAGRGCVLEAFSHDSRQLLPGEMFVAVRGEHSDGHDYLLDATRRGAAGLLAEARVLAALGEDARLALEQAAIPVVTVEDTRIALQQYARFILERWHPTVIAITGSVGKTSTKDALASVLSSHFATFKSWQNYNDLLGVPLSLGRLEPRHEYAVIELGCDHPGEMRALCDITRPAIGVLTGISPAQLQYFGTLERYAGELQTMLAALPPHGIGFVNGDTLALPPSCQAPIIPYFPSQATNVTVTWDGVGAQFIAPNAPDIASMTAMTTVPLPGRHHVATMMATALVAAHCGMQVEEIQHALAKVQPLAGRLNPLPGVSGTVLLDDTHNAVPASVIAGLETLRELPAGRRIAVLGDMLRLGDYEEEAHRLVGEQAARCADYVIARGERAALIAEAAIRAGLPEQHVTITSTHEDAAQVARHIVESAADGHVKSDPRQKDVILIKGSEETRMERVTELLMARPTEAPERLVRQTPGWKQIVVMRAERPTWVEVDLSAIASNTRQLKALVGPDVRLLASLKADAYGHGALKVARTVLHNGASMIGVATASEATPLREAGITVPILVFGYVPLWQMREAVRLGLTITLYSLESAQALSRAAQALDSPVNVHVKVDTGMGRLGVRVDTADDVGAVIELVEAIRALPNLTLEGIFTHFATADSADQTWARQQLSRFQAVLRVLDGRGLRPPLVHAANSAAALSLPEARFDMVRPGIALYGLDPSDNVCLPEGFRPALSFKTQVAQVKLVPAGECISYGCTYTTPAPTLIATLPVGYADGFRRAPHNWGTVLIHGQEAPIVGRVCMDQCMVDVSRIPQTRVGDEVVLIGRQGDATLTAETVARRLGTVNYEVVSAILARVPRVD